MKDIEHNPSSTTKYECLACGHIVETDTRPGRCERCGELDALRDRGYTRE